MTRCSSRPNPVGKQRLAVRNTILVVLVAMWGGCGYSPTKRAPGRGDFTQQDVQRFISAGQPVAEVTNRFGVPEYTKTNQFNQVLMHFHSGLPQTYSPKTVVIAGEPGYVFAGFDLWATNGKVMRWRAGDWEKVGR